ncbi:hypothetical protein [Streptomyces sp. NPDC056191]|uniref:hypothetical protein n=1 Tax=Streptomyces sp. NPDC056191 TaxID=3345742 RepID=UPI0035D9EF90
MSMQPEAEPEVGPDAGTETGTDVGTDVGFEAFARAAQQRLYRTAYLLCGEPETARDLTVVTDDPRFLELVKAADADPMETPAPLDPSEDPMNPFRWG